MQEVYINCEFIKLQQFLKLTSIVSQGADAKILLLDKLVKVNGTIENRRGKKLRNNDIVEVKGFGKYKIILKN